MQTSETTICRTESTAAETIANIEDLLTYVLLRFPARSLLRFHCVSKYWLSLISDPKFRQRHTLRYPNPKISGFFPDSVIPKEHMDIIPLGKAIPSRINPPKAIYDSCYRTIHILQSCNGLFLCQSEVSPASFFVVNPTTNQFNDVTCPHNVEPSQCLYGLGFDPSESPYYKVVCLAWQDIGSLEASSQIRVYSSQTRAWRLLPYQKPMSFLLSPQHVSKHAVYCSVAIHWIRSKDFAGTADNTVLYFYNVNKERLGMSQADFRHDIHNQVVCRYFGESGGHLHLIDTCVYDFNQFDVKEMWRDYSGWCVKYHVDLNPIMALFPDKSPLWYKCDFVVLLYPRADPVKRPPDEEVVSLHVAGKVVSYNHRNKTVTTVYELTNEDKLLVSDSSHGYMESLACV